MTHDDVEAQPDDPKQRWFMLVVLALGVALIVIDGTIVNVSLPVIIEDLDLGFTNAQWVTTIYSLVFAGLLLTMGRIGDRFGRRRLFLAGVVVFIAGSLYAGLSNNAAHLIAARTIQGIGGAFILPNTLSTVNAVFRGRDRAVAFAVWGSVMSGSAAVGPLLGGWLTTSYSWRWIFFINIPVGILILLGILRYVEETRGENLLAGIDIAGVLLSTISLGALVFGLVEGRAYGWWAPTRALDLPGMTWPATTPLSAPAAALGTGVLGLVLFILWERHRERMEQSALLNLSLFSFRSFRWGNTAALLISLGEFGILFTLPLFLQNVLGLTALKSGLVLAGLAVGAFVAGGIAGRLAQRISPAWVASLGVGLEIVGLVILAIVLRADSSSWLITGILVIYGVGLGLASAQLTSVVLSDVPPDLSGQGSATQSTVRQLGSALGIAILATILASTLTSQATDALDHISELPPDTATGIENALSETAGGIIQQIREGHTRLPTDIVEPVVEQLAISFTDATRLTLVVGAGFLAIALAASLRLPHPPPTGKHAPTRET